MIMVRNFALCEIDEKDALLWCGNFPTEKKTVHSMGFEPTWTIAQQILRLPLNHSGKEVYRY